MYTLAIMYPVLGIIPAYIHPFTVYVYVYFPLRHKPFHMTHVILYISHLNNNCNMTNRVGGITID